MRISDWSSDGCSSDLLANTRYQPLEEERLIRLFLSQSPAALILVGIDQTEGAAELLSAAEQPVAPIMELGPQPFDMMVGFSQFDAGRAMKIGRASCRERVCQDV